MSNKDIYNGVLLSYYHPSYLCHHGVKGQKWGIRNYQNSDGTLTSAGKERYRSNAHVYKPRSRDTMQRELASGKMVTVSGGSGEQYYEVEDWEKENLQMEDDIRKYEAIAEDENATPEEREDALRRANVLRRNLESKRKAEQAFLSEWVSSQEVWRSLGHEDTMDYNDVLKSYYDTSFLCHHGILGQKWGVRRFQNKDGTRTLLGKKRYAKTIETQFSQLKENVKTICNSDTGEKYHLSSDIDTRDVTINRKLKDRSTTEYFANKEFIEGSCEVNVGESKKCDISFGYDQRKETPEQFTKRLDRSVQNALNNMDKIVEAGCTQAYEKAKEAYDAIPEIREYYKKMPSKEEYKNKFSIWSISDISSKDGEKTIVYFTDETQILYEDLVGVTLDENGKVKKVVYEH